MWARIDDENRCAEIVTDDPEGRFHPSITWVPVPAALGGWADSSYVRGAEGTAVPPSLDAIKAQAKARLAARRWTAETAGALLPDGTRVPTRDRDKTLLAGARDKALEEVEEAIAAALAAGDSAEDGRAAGLARMHTLDVGGRPLTATNEMFIAMARAIGAHVQATFDRWGVVWHAIDAAETWQEVVSVYAAEIDRGWPGDPPTSA